MLRNDIIAILEKRRDLRTASHSPKKVREEEINAALGGGIWEFAQGIGVTRYK